MSSSSSFAEASTEEDRNDLAAFQVTVKHNSVPWKIEVDCDDNDSERTTRNIGDADDRGESVCGKLVTDDLLLESMKTVLVPVRDPVTMQIKETLVPIEMTDQSGMNIIKSVLIPINGEDGRVCYEIKKVVVPIRSEWGSSQRKRDETDKKQTASKSAGKRMNTRNAIAELDKIKLEVTGWEDARGNEKRDSQRVERQRIEQARLVELSEETKVDDLVAKADESHILDTLRTTCPFCEKCYKDEAEMRKHVQKVHRKPFSCDKCYRGYFTEYALEEHQKTHEVVSFYQCSVCQMQYKTTGGLKNHQVREHSNIDPKYTCDHCGKRFKLKLDLALHIDRSHMKDSHICRFCGMRVKNIVHHELKHERNKKHATQAPPAPTPPPLFRCEFCPRTFKTWNNMENHLLLKHKGSKQGSDMLRTLCEKKFESRSDFYDHVLNQAESRLYRCDMCGKTYTNKDNLRNHIGQHSQAFLCTHCGKNFSSNYALKLHMRTHTGERPYQCKVCLKMFARSTSLRVHQLTHTGQRPYVCDICGQNFTQRSSMMAHRRKHPGNHPPPPPFVLSKLENNGQH